MYMFVLGKNKKQKNQPCTEETNTLRLESQLHHFLTAWRSKLLSFPEIQDPICENGNKTTQISGDNRK